VLGTEAAPLRTDWPCTNEICGGGGGDDDDEGGVGLCGVG
jgi:hypothetical protein